MSADETIQALAQKIAGRFHPQKIILFGSRVEGNPDAQSDVDLLVIQETDLPLPRRGLEIREFIHPLPFPLDLLVFTPAEVAEQTGVRGTFINMVLRKGRVLYG